LSLNAYFFFSQNLRFFSLLPFQTFFYFSKTINKKFFVLFFLATKPSLNMLELTTTKSMAQPPLLLKLLGEPTTKIF